MIDVVVAKTLTDHLLEQVGLFIGAFRTAETRNLAAELPSKLAELTARLNALSAHPVPYDSCLPGCTAQKACGVAKDRYSNFFGPYYPPVPLIP